MAAALKPFEEPLVVPSVLRSKRNWIGWRAVPNANDPTKIDKIPVCINTGYAKGYTDPRNHVTYDEAVAAIGRLGLSGVGFVLTPDCGMLGGDMDKCRDPVTGLVNAREQSVIDRRETYFEVSPSGRGVRFFSLTDMPLRDPVIAKGIEIYSSGRFLTFTGDHISGTPWEVQRAPYAVDMLMKWAADAKAADAAAKAAQTPSSGQAPAAGSFEERSAREAYRTSPMGRINQAALGNLGAWVPEVFPSAEFQSGTGAYRVKQADLGRPELQEDLSIAPGGVKDWGVHDMGDVREGSRTPIDIVMEWGGFADHVSAAEWLGIKVGLPFVSGVGSSGGSPGDEAPDPGPLVALPWTRGKTIPPREWLVRGGWVPMKKVTLVQGDGGDGKTLLLHQLQASCATGLQWLGLDVEPCVSVGVYTEDDDYDVEERQAAIDLAYGVECCASGRMHRFPRADGDNELVVFDRARRPVLTKFYGRVVEAVMDLGAKLLVLDVAVDLFGGNEIVRPEVRALFRPLGRLARSMGGAVVMSTHVSQSGIRTDGGHSGSTDWSNAARSRLYLNRPKDDKGVLLDPDARTLTRKKSNYAALGDTVRLRWAAGVMVLDGPSGKAAAMFGRPVEDVFVALLRAVTGEGQNVSHKPNSGNYAPTVFGRRSPAERGGYGRGDFARAMQTVLRDRRVKIESYGRASNLTDRLVENII